MVLKGTIRMALASALLALTALAAGCQGNPADPIVEPGPPALEPRATEVVANPSILATGAPGDVVTLSMSFEDLDTAELGQVLVLGQLRIQYVAGGAQTLTLPIPAGTLAAGTAPGPYAASFTNAELLALEVSPGQSVGDLLAASGAQEYAFLADVFARNSQLLATNTVSTDYPRPQLNGLSVRGGAPGELVETVLDGFDFIGATRVLVEGTGVTASITEVTDENQVRASFDIAADAPAGPRSVRVFTPGGVSARSSAAEFEVITPQAPQFASQSLLPGQQGALYQARLVAAGGTAPLAFSVASGTLPAGLTLSPTTGEIAGTPTGAGTFLVTVRVTDAAALSDQIALALDIAPTPSDGRTDIANPCNPWANAVVANNNTTLAERATGSPDTVLAALNSPVSPAVAGRAVSPSAPLTLVSDLDGSYVVFDMGATACEQVVASPANAVDLRYNDPDGHADAVLVWLSNDPTRLDRLIGADARNEGTFTPLPVGLDAGGDGQRFRYVIVASNDVGIPNLDNLEAVPDDLTAPETTLLLAEKVDGSLLPALNGTTLHATVSGDDTQAGDNPLGTTDKFRYRLDDLTAGVTGTWQVTAADALDMGEIFEGALADGDYELLVAAVDPAGNEDPTPATTTFTIDATPPVVVNLATGGTSLYRAPTGGFASVPVTADVTDAASGVSLVVADPDGPGNPEPILMILGVPPQYTGTFDGNAFLGAPLGGNFSVVLRAFDAFGNEGTAAVPVTVNVNAPPAASAGPDQAVSEGVLLSLDGSATSDPEGDPVSLAWTQTGGPQVLLTGADTAAPTFTAPLVATNTPAVLTFALTASDNWNGVASDSVTITVNNLNRDPIANAGPDDYVKSSELVTLDGTGSSDPDADALTPVWALVGKSAGAPNVTLAGAGSFTPTFTAPVLSATQWVYTFQLTVTDGNLGLASDTVDVIVRDLNLPPVANAGPDRAVVDSVSNEPNGVLLDGTGSSDPDGSIISYTWSLIAGNPAEILNWSLLNKTQSTLAIPRFAAGSSKDFVFQLQVTDNDIVTSTDTVTVSVRHYCPQTFSLIDRTQNFPETSLLALDPPANRAYVLSGAVGGLLRFDAGAATTQTLATSGTLGASDLALNSSTGKLYWINPTDGTLRVLDTAAGDVTTTIALGGTPAQLALNESAAEAYVLDRTGSGTLHVLDAALGLRGSVDLQLGNAAGAVVRYNPAAARAVVLAPADFSLIFVDPSVPAVTATVPADLSGDLQNPIAPQDLQVEAGSGELLITHEFGFSRLDSAGTFIAQYALAAGGLRFHVLPQSVGGFFYASNEVAPGGATSEHRLYKVDAATGGVTSVLLGNFADTAVATALAYDPVSDKVAVLEGTAAGASRLFLTPSVALAPVGVGLGGTEGLALSLMSGPGLFYTLQRGRTLTQVDPVTSSASHVRLGFDAADLAIDTVSREVFVAGGITQEVRVVLPGDPIDVFGVDVAEPSAALVLAEDRGELYSLNLPRATMPEESFSVSLYDGAAATLLDGPTPLGPVGGRLDAAYDAAGGPAGLLYVADPAAASIRVIDLSSRTLARTISLPVTPRALLFDGTRRQLWASAYGDDRLVRIDVDSGDALQLVPTLAGPSEMALHSGNGLLYVRCEIADRVIAVDPTTATVPFIVDVGPLGRDGFGSSLDRGRRLAIDSITGNVLVLTGSFLAAIDPADEHRVRFSNQLSGGELLSMALDEGRRLLFAVDGTRDLRIVDLAQDLAASRLTLPLAPAARLVVVDPDPIDGRVYVAGTHHLAVVHLDGSCASGVQYARARSVAPVRRRYGLLMPEPGKNKVKPDRRKRAVRAIWRGGGPAQGAAPERGPSCRGLLAGGYQNWPAGPAWADPGLPPPSFVSSQHGPSVAATGCVARTAVGEAKESEQ